jgi:ketosteroid isomerase-like protein
MTAIEQVRAAEERRGAAMLAGDAAAMDPLLAEGLTFIHATGGMDDKPTLLAKMQGGAIVYHSIAWSEQKIDVRDTVAAMSGVMTLQVTVAGVDKTLHNRAILLWERDGQAGWKLFHFQSTPIQGR